MPQNLKCQTSLFNQHSLYIYYYAAPHANRMLQVQLNIMSGTTLTDWQALSREDKGY